VGRLAGEAPEVMGLAEDATAETEPEAVDPAPATGPAPGRLVGGAGGGARLGKSTLHASPQLSLMNR